MAVGVGGGGLCRVPRRPTGPFRTTRHADGGHREQGNPGNFFEDFTVGQVIEHATPRTVTEGDRALYGAHELWVRPAAMFEEQVVIDGRAMPRFERCEGQPDVSADLKGPLQTG